MKSTIITCDFCNLIIDDGWILRYKRSIFGFLKIIPKILWNNFFISDKFVNSKNKYYICSRCKVAIRERIFADPNLVEELQHLCQNNGRQQAHHDTYALPFTMPNRCPDPLVRIRR